MVKPHKILKKKTHQWIATKLENSTRGIPCVSPADEMQLRSSAQRRPPPQINHGEPPVVEETTPGEKQGACGETFSKNSPFFTRRGEEVPSSILREWTLRPSRRGCHISLLLPPRMGRKRCDNPYCAATIQVLVSGNNLLLCFLTSKILCADILLESQ